MGGSFRGVHHAPPYYHWVYQTYVNPEEFICVIISGTFQDATSKISGAEAGARSATCGEWRAQLPTSAARLEIHATSTLNSFPRTEIMENLAFPIVVEFLFSTSPAGVKD